GDFAMRVATPFLSRNTPPFVLPSSLPKSPANTSPLGLNANEVGVERPDAKAVTVPPAGAVGRGGPAATALDAPTTQAPATARAASPRTLIIPSLLWSGASQRPVDPNGRPPQSGCGYPHLLGSLRRL